MKIKLITGSFPPDVCGVGDYTSILIKELEKVGLETLLYNNKDWNIKKIFKIKKEICEDKCSIYHLQYPTQGYGYSLVPSFLSFLFLKKNFVITLHEYTSKSLKGKIAEIFLACFAKYIIFTTEYERRAVLKILPFKRNKSSVINIGSNIEFNKEVIKEKKYDVVYFGHIRPMKGIEEFIEAFKKNNNNNIKFYIIGQVLPEYNEYYLKIKEENKEIEFIINKSMKEVKEILSKSKIAYLHFPDGVSYRRGSFLAAFGNGATIITTKGKDTSKDFDEICNYVISSEEASLKIKEILLQENEYFEKLEEIRKKIIKNISWSNIAEMHTSVYKSLLGEKNENTNRW